MKSIVSDIDDAPIVTAEQNNELSSINEEKKERLKAAKEKLGETQENIRLLAPLVEQGEFHLIVYTHGLFLISSSLDYQQVKQATERAAFLSQKIIEARTALMLLRQTHPKPRLTIPLADQKLTEQVEEMQTLMEKVQEVKQKGKAEKARLKSGTSEVENLRMEAAEAQITLKNTQMEEEDSRLVPLYDWYVTIRPCCSNSYTSAGLRDPWLFNDRYPTLKILILNQKTNFDWPTS